MKLNKVLIGFFEAIFENPKESRLEKVFKRIFASFSISEKTWFIIFAITMTISGAILLLNVNNYFLTEVPAVGGRITEGIVGSPRFLNPVLAISDTDKSIASLIYSGLTRYQNSRKIINDMASNIEVSEDGLQYTVTISEDAVFHDNFPVTSDDVIFTVEKARDPIIKSPKESTFDKVSIEKIDQRTVKFILPEKKSNFLDTLTFGILPKHIWQSATSEEFPFSPLNIDPIGSGPYKIVSVKKNSAGIPTSISLELSKKYTALPYKVQNVLFKFYQNEEALHKAIQTNEVSNAILSSGDKVETSQSEKAISSSLPRVFGIFFNQNNAQTLLHKEVRLALETATPKNTIVNEVLRGRGSVITGILPQFSRDLTENETEEIYEQAKKILLDAGWQIGEDGIMSKKTKSGTEVLQFSIATSDNSDLKKVAEIIKSSWGKIGAKVKVEIFETSDLNQNVIRPRKYDALLFGEVVNSESDLYTFWHSSQRNDPGLNIAMYANITTDKILEELRNSASNTELSEKTKQLNEEIVSDIPAIFLFSPNYTYLYSEDIKNVSLDKVSSTHDRYRYLSDWYIETNRVWSMFASN